jgi:hypothetical protein
MRNDKDIKKLSELYESIMLKSDSSIDGSKNYEAQYMSADGVIKNETFSGVNALDDLKKWIDEWVGLNGDISDDFNYIVSDDGIGRIHVKGLPQGGLSELLGREPKPKIQGGGYGRTLAKIAFDLNIPKELHNYAKIENTYGGQGMSFVIDFDRDIIIEKTSQLPSGKSFNYREKFDKGRFVINIQEYEWSGDMSASVNIFYTAKNMYSDYRVLDERIEFKASGNREEDLQKVEGIFKYPEIDETIEYLISNKDNIKRNSSSSVSLRL